MDLGGRGIIITAGVDQPAFESLFLEYGRYAPAPPPPPPQAGGGGGGGRAGGGGGPTGFQGGSSRGQFLLASP
eukprot:COSAG04_NODE_26436_length_295_cov_0.372449_1_plen_72_part_01